MSGVSATPRLPRARTDASVVPFREKSSRLSSESVRRIRSFSLMRWTRSDEALMGTLQAHFWRCSIPNRTTLSWTISTFWFPCGAAHPHAYI